MTEPKQSWAKVFDFVTDVGDMDYLDIINERLRGLNAIIKQATYGYLRLSTRVHEQGPDLVDGSFVTIYGSLLLIDREALHDGTSDVLAKVPLFAIRAHNPLQGKGSEYGLDVLVDCGITTYTAWHGTQEEIIKALELVLLGDHLQIFLKKVFKLAILANNNINP